MKRKTRERLHALEARIDGLIKKVALCGVHCDALAAEVATVRSRSEADAYQIERLHNAVEHLQLRMVGALARKRKGQKRKPRGKKP